MSASESRAAASDDRLALALLPVLLHDLNNATQYLSALNTIVELEGPASARLAGLASAARDVDELGWLLGVCANGIGADLLGDRRVARGLGPMVRAVAKGLRREGRDLAEPARGVPDLRVAGAAGDPWRTTWAVGSWLFACGRALPSGARLAWRLDVDADGASLACEVGSTSELEATARAITTACPGLEFEFEPGRSTLWIGPGRLDRAMP